MQEFIDDPMAVLVMLVIIGLILSTIEHRYYGTKP
jgi:hypothetical protein